VTDSPGAGRNYGGPNPIGGPSPAPPAGWAPAAPPQAPGGPVPQQWQTPPPQQPPGWGQPGTPEWGPQFPVQPHGGRRHRKALLVTVGAGVAVIVVIVIVGAFTLFGGGGGGGAGSPSAAVKGYLEALARGDAEAALSDGADQPASKELLTDDILKKQIEKMPISNIRILGDNAADAAGVGQVHVTVSFGDQSSDATLPVKKADGRWKLDASAVRLDFSRFTATNQAMETLTAFGKPVGKSVAYVFPGWIDWGSSNKNIAVKAKPVLLESLSSSAAATVVPTLSVSDAARAAIVANLKQRLDTCAQSKSVLPERCPQRMIHPGIVDGTVTWRAPDANSAEIQFNPLKMAALITMQTTFGFTAQTRDGSSVTGDAPAVVIGEADLSQSPPTINWH
jgi:hypothetical protein